MCVWGSCQGKVPCSVSEEERREVPRLASHLVISQGDAGEEPACCEGRGRLDPGLSRWLFPIRVPTEDATCLLLEGRPDSDLA